jgi:hypothetical protein
MRSGQEPFEAVAVADENYFVAQGLGPEQTYEFKVTTLDMNRNESQFSNVVSIKTGNDLSKLTYEEIPVNFEKEKILIKKIKSNDKKHDPLQPSKEAENLPKIKSETGRIEENIELTAE